MDEEPCTREKAISSMLRFYNLLTQLPYIPADKLQLPPPGGWPLNTEAESEIERNGNPGIKASILRHRGKTDLVIETLQHLPYFEQDLYGREDWTLADSTLHINYARGQLYGAYLEKDTAILPLPGHIIWLTEGFERAGVYLLLNTETWEIIEYTLLGESVEIDYDAYEALRPDQRWTAYSAMPANEYFDLWWWRHATLQFVLLRDEGAFKGTAEWWCKDPRHLYEESFVQGEEEDDDEVGQEDDDYVPPNRGNEGDADEMSIEDEDESAAGSDEMEEEEEEEEEIQPDELQSLSFDLNQPLPPIAKPEHTTETTPTHPKATKSFLYKLAQTLRPKDPYNNNKNADPRANFTDPWNTTRRAKMRELVNILIDHGWPVPEYEYRVSGRYITTNPKEWELDLSGFKREECLQVLHQWMTEHKEQERAALFAATQS